MPPKPPSSRFFSIKCKKSKTTEAVVRIWLKSISFARTLLLKSISGSSIVSLTIASRRIWISASLSNIPSSFTQGRFSFDSRYGRIKRSSTAWFIFPISNGDIKSVSKLSSLSRSTFWKIHFLAHGKKFFISDCVIVIFTGASVCLGARFSYKKWWINSSAQFESKDESALGFREFIHFSNADFWRCVRRSGSVASNKNQFCSVFIKSVLSKPECFLSESSVSILRALCATAKPAKLCSL